MDTDAVARLTRLMGRVGTRRAALGAILGITFLGTRQQRAVAKDPRRRRRSRQHRHSETKLGDEAQPTRVRIDVTAARGAEFGIFTMVGDTEGGGTVTTEPRFSAGGAPDFLIIHAAEVFTAASGVGTFTIKRQIKVTPKGDPNTDEILTGTGTWVMTEGTGAYEGLHGQGLVTLTIDETQNPDQFTFIFTGQMRQ